MGCNFKVISVSNVDFEFFREQEGYNDNIISGLPSALQMVKFSDNRLLRHESYHFDEKEYMY